MTTKKADELAGEAGKQIARLVLATALLGGGARAGIGALRTANPRYEALKPPSPIVVDMPYPVDGPLPNKPAVPGKEKQLAGARPSPLPKFAADLPDWAQSLPLGLGERLYNNLPTYTPPAGKPGETNPDNVPLMGAAYLAGGLGGLGAGYKVTDAVMRAADRRNAHSELEDAQREYQETVLKRLAASRLPAKSAADQNPPAEMTNVRTAIEGLYDVLKSAGEGDPVPTEKPHAGLRTLASLLWPGLIGGPDAARYNMAIAAGIGGLGAYAGYNNFRDDNAKGQLAKRIKDVEAANVNGLKSPVVGRLVPVPRQPV